jgi:hypothetical protein
VGRAAAVRERMRARAIEERHSHAGQYAC